MWKFLIPQSSSFTQEAANILRSILKSKGIIGRVWVISFDIVNRPNWDVYVSLSHHAYGL